MPLKVAGAPIVGLLIIIGAVLDRNVPFIFVGLAVMVYGIWAWLRYSSG
ncbi:MAG: hypothetical protein IBX63_09910 [Coriobacteriia bacterium]|nr:hypothetical protein [Coriobacteriia bacterium]